MSAAQIRKRKRIRLPLSFNYQPVPTFGLMVTRIPAIEPHPAHHLLDVSEQRSRIFVAR
jgi:hypothetical protein